MTDNKEADEVLEKIDVLIGTDEDKIWKDVADRTGELIKSMEGSLIVNKEILELAKSKINAKTF